MSVLTHNGRVLKSADGKTYNMNDLIIEANETTGADDKTLHDAVDTLIDGYGSAVIEEKTITENGTYEAGAGVNGFSPVVVNVPSSEPAIEPKTITANGTYTPSSGVDGFSPVVVNVPAGGGGWYEATWTAPSTVSNAEVIVATSDELKEQRSNNSMIVLVELVGQATADCMTSACMYNGAKNSGCSGFSTRYALAIDSYSITRLYGKTLHDDSSGGAGCLRIDTNGNLLYSATSGSLGVAQGCTYKIRAAWTEE